VVRTEYGKKMPSHLFAAKLRWRRHGKPSQVAETEAATIKHEKLVATELSARPIRKGQIE